MHAAEVVERAPATAREGTVVVTVSMPAWRAPSLPATSRSSAALRPPSLSVCLLGEAQLAVVAAEQRHAELPPGLICG